jgi:ABC-type amino acid transport system permease subunit
LFWWFFLDLGGAMIKILKIIVGIINQFHDILIKLFKGVGMQLTDKQLHFIIIGVIGMIIYLVVNKLFKVISKYSISVISFIYTVTVLVVIVFSIEIGQKITKRGNMEFADITAGLWGFTVLFAVYIIIYGGTVLIKKFMKNMKKKSFKKR